MQRENSELSETSEQPAAYLIVREGDSWRDVFRLAPGQVNTIGRAPTNRVVIRDEICSRNHCEIFQNGSTWTLRDLGSRNGTLINGRPVLGDWPLYDGQLIQIGQCELGFTLDPTRHLPQFDYRSEPGSDAETAVYRVSDHGSGHGGPEIIHRARRSRFRSPNARYTVGRDRTSQELANLYRLGLEMGAAKNARELSEVVLDGLFSETVADIGAVLLLSRGTTSDAPARRLKVAAYKSLGGSAEEDEAKYEQVSEHLSGVVLESREAVLARDVGSDTRLSGRDSLGELQAESLICAPVLHHHLLYGVIHLYATNPDNPLDRDDLEFTMAVADQLAVALSSMKERESLAIGLARAQDENQELRQQLEIQSEIVGEDPKIQQLRDDIARIAPTDATVLIRGESGVGKELVARSIHFQSNRSPQPFNCMNCAALSESLLESELFGHEKGSFTGATERKIGKFEQSHKGTLFLDEVGEMNLATQARFLRVLEGHPFERVGGSKPIRVDVRVVAATNRDLEKAVAHGMFRQDLYFRLQVVELSVATLREHASDIPLLANHFLERCVQKTGRPIQGFTPGAVQMLVEYDWPGNIRELQNTVERAVILSRDETIQPEDIQLSNLKPVRTPEPASHPADGDHDELSLQSLERDHILATLERTGWNKSRASQILGIERSTLDRKLKRYQIKRPKS